MIVGAGAVGSYLAGKLARCGYRVLVIDKKPAAGQDICCTGIVSKPCLDLLSIHDELILRQVYAAKFFAASGEGLRLSRSEPVAYVIERPSLDRKLADRAQSYGVSYKFGACVADIQTGADAVVVTVDFAQQSELFEAEAAVIATGLGSPLPAQLGLGEIRDYAMGAQAEVSLIETTDVEIYFDQELARGGFAWLVPYKDHTGFAGLLTHRQPKHQLDRFLSILKAQGKIMSKEAATSFGAIPLRPLPRTFSDRILIVGEAAGQVKPITGGGIYFGLLCADIAAETIQQAFQGQDLSASRLALYQKRWRAKLTKELRVGYWAHRLYGKLGNRQINRLHHLISNNGMPRFITGLDDLPFDWHSELAFKVLTHLALAIPTVAIRSVMRHDRSANLTGRR